MAGAISQPRQSCQFLFCLMKNPLLSVFARYPIRGTFVDRCASAGKPRAMSITPRAKLPSFRLFIFLTPIAFRLTAGCACFVPEPGQNIHLPLSKKKQADLE